MDPRYLNSKDTAKYLSITVTTLKKLVNQGIIPPPKRFGKNLIRYDTQEINDKLGEGVVYEKEDRTGSD